MNMTPIASLAAVLALSTAATATTIDIGAFSTGAYSGATAGLTNVVTEDFERLGGANGEGEIAPGTSLPTAVGTFETLGGTGSGGTVTQLAGNTGTNVALRDGNVFGRTNLTPGGSYFLDSNDTHGIGWDVSGLGLFDTLVFSITDASEFSFFRVTVNGVSAEQRVGASFANGSTSLVQISLDTAVSSLRIDLGNFSSSGGSVALNDGFSLDDITVGLTPVPVPASLPLLAFGAGALGFMRRKQRKSA